MIPVCKVLETIVSGFYFDECPWIDYDNSEKYLDMARISIVTIVYTIYLAVIFLICRGWNIILFNLTRNQATYLTMIMGATYLSYSAYFLSSDFEGIRVFMLIILVILYGFLGFMCLKNLVHNIKII